MTKKATAPKPEEIIIPTEEVKTEETIIATEEVKPVEQTPIPTEEIKPEETVITSKPKTKKEKAPKPPKAPRPISPYGVGVDVICKNPDIARDAFKASLIKAGLSEEQATSAGANTAWAQAKSMIKKLRAAGNMKG